MLNLDQLFFRVRFTCNWQIDPRIVDLSWPAGVTFTYDGTNHEVKATISNIAGTDTVSPSYTETGTTVIESTTYQNKSSSTNANDYISIVSALNNNDLGNYRLPTNTGGVDPAEDALYAKLTKIWKVNKRTVSFIFGSGSFTYDATLKGIDVTFSNLVVADTSANNIGLTIRVDSILGGSGTPYSVTTSGSTTNFAHSVQKVNADTYTIYVTGVTSTNYTLTPDSGQFIIEKATLSIGYTEVYTSGMRLSEYNYTYSKAGQGTQVLFRDLSNFRSV